MRRAWRRCRREPPDNILRRTPEHASIVTHSCYEFSINSHVLLLPLEQLCEELTWGLETVHCAAERSFDREGHASYLMTRYTSEMAASRIIRRVRKASWSSSVHMALHCTHALCSCFPNRHVRSSMFECNTMTCPDFRNFLAFFHSQCCPQLYSSLPSWSAFLSSTSPSPSSPSLLSSVTDQGSYTCTSPRCGITSSESRT